MVGLEQHIRGVIGCKNQNTDTDKVRQQRVAVVREALLAGYATDGNTYPSLTAAPWSVPLTTAIAAQMRVDLDKRKLQK